MSRPPGSKRRVPPVPGWLSRWWLDRSIRSKGLVVIAIPLIALTVIASASLALEANERQVRAVSTHASNLRTAAEAVLVDALNAETGVRGYAATGDPFFLKPYQLALGQAAADNRSFRAAAAADGAYRQWQAANATETQVLATLAFVRRDVGVAGQALLPLLLAGKMHMDLLRSQIGDLVSRADAVVTTRRADITGQEIAIEELNIVGLVLGVLAGIAGIALFTLGISRRITAAAADAQRLGEGQPVQPSDRSRDAIGHLSDSLTRAGQLLDSRTAELTAARDQAVLATRTKNTFMSRTSHELRTPLNSILGFAQLLAMSDLSEEDRDSAGRILEAGRHLLALINEIIDIARIESGKLSLSLEPISLLTLVEDTSQLMAPLAAARSITISQDCPRTGLAVQADQQRLSQVLVNLLSNAVKYNREGGTIAVTCREEGADQVSLVVADTGPGIAEENLERIFVPFERVGAEFSGVEGTGIGLPLAKALTEAMGGQLTVSSVPGEGSAFTVSLRRAPYIVPAPRGETAPAAPGAPAGAGLSLLYIEDNPANTEVIARFMVTRPSSRLKIAMSGQAGLDCAVREVPDVILLDVHLPDIPGDLVLNELKSRPATAAIPVVILSADATPVVMRRMLSAGAVAYLTKPVDLSELGGLLDNLAQHARRHRLQAAERHRAEAGDRPEPEPGDAERPGP